MQGGDVAFGAARHAPHAPLQVVHLKFLADLSPLFSLAHLYQNMPATSHLWYKFIRSKHPNSP